MTKLKLLSAGLIAAAMIAAPAIARESHVARRHHAAESYAVSATPGMHYADGRVCVPAPRVGAYATQPWENETPCLPPSVY